MGRDDKVNGVDDPNELANYDDDDDADSVGPTVPSHLARVQAGQAANGRSGRTNNPSITLSISAESQQNGEGVLDNTVSTTPLTQRNPVLSTLSTSSMRPHDVVDGESKDEEDEKAAELDMTSEHDPMMGDNDDDGIVEEKTETDAEQGPVGKHSSSADGICDDESASQISPSQSAEENVDDENTHNAAAMADQLPVVVPESQMTASRDDIEPADDALETDDTRETAVDEPADQLDMSVESNPDEIECDDDEHDDETLE